MHDRNGNVKDRREMLRVKIKSLAGEARIIRHEETRVGGVLADELRMHRRGIVRQEARLTHLAYGIIRGRPVERIEQPKRPLEKQEWDRVRQMISRYGPADKEAKSAMLEKCPQ